MSQPLVSVVIPCFRARRTLPALLASLERQTLPRADFEVLVVDDGSDDGSGECVAAGPGIRLLAQDRRGPGAARNRGSAVARAPLLLFLDADLAADPGLVEAHLGHHRAHPDLAATGGSVSPAEDYPLLSWALADHFSSWFNAHPATRPGDAPEYLPSLNFAVKRRLVEERGVTWENGREGTGEDVLFCRQLRRHGLRMAFLPGARVFHQDRRTWTAHARHMYRWGLHAPSVRGRFPDLRYRFLFPRRRRGLLFTLPLIVAGYTALIWMAWLRVRPVAVTLALPQILLGRLAYACGVWRGTGTRGIGEGGDVLSGAMPDDPSRPAASRGRTEPVDKVR